MEDYIIEHTPDYNNPVLTVEDLVVKFNLRGQVLTAVRGISLELYKGESLAIVGESGSGKSVFTKSFIGMLDTNGWVEQGEMLLDGVNIAKYKTEKEWLKVRGKKIAMVFQDPMTSLNPVKTIGEQIREVITYQFGTDKAQAKKEAIELLRQVGINDPEQRYKQYPHEFSGGMRQRVVIATAIACRPKILICDEPTTALDVTVQAQILDLIKRLQKEMDMSVIYITHDLGVVANVADRVAVMYAGRIVEQGTLEDVFDRTKHPYTEGLFNSLPNIQNRTAMLKPIKGLMPDPTNLPEGCAFAPRCDYATEECHKRCPKLTKISDTHSFACLAYEREGFHIKRGNE